MRVIIMGNFIYTIGRFTAPVLFFMLLVGGVDLFTDAVLVPAFYGFGWLAQLIWAALMFFLLFCGLIYEVATQTYTNKIAKYLNGKNVTKKEET